MTEERNDRPAEAETLASPPLDGRPSLRGLESEVLLARARAKLLKIPETPPPKIGRYRVERRLGAGGMGVVYAARDDELGRPIAIKLLSSTLARTPDGRRRLIREARALAAVSHPNVVHVYEIGEAGEQVFLAMELVEGQTLRAWQRAQKRPWREIVAKYLEAARGLQAAHAVGLVHRDYKPENVLVDDDGVPRVVDFGLARHSAEAPDTEAERDPFGDEVEGDGADLTLTGTVLGTPAYMAPEQMTGGDIDHRADQYAFCVSLYEALCGDRPFTGRSVTALMDSRRKGVQTISAARGLPRRLRAAIRRGLELEPADRFPSMVELGDALARCLAPGWTGAKRVVAVLGIGAAAFTLAFASRGDDPTTPPPSSSPAVEPSTPAELEAPLPGDPAHVTIQRLDNGLTVFVASLQGLPSVEAAVVVRADENDEGPDQAGFTTLLRSMIAGGTELGSVDPAAEAPLLAKFRDALERRDHATDPADLEALAEEAFDALDASREHAVFAESITLGAELGFSSPEILNGPGWVHTHTVPANRLDAWAAIASEQIRHMAYRDFFGAYAAFRDGLVEATAAPEVVALQRGVAAITGLPLDPEARIATLRRMPFTALRDFREALTVPNNTAIVFVGDVEPAAVRQIVERHFGAWAPAELPPRLDPPEPSTPARTVVTAPGPAQVRIAWPLRVVDPTVAELTAIEDILLSGPLPAAWFEADGRARFIEVDWEPHYFQAVLEPQTGHTAEEAEAALDDYLQAAADGRHDATLLERARGRARLTALNWTESDRTLLFHIADAYTRGIEWAEYIPRLGGEPVATTNIASAAAKLRRGPAAVVHRKPGKAEPQDIPLAPVPRRPGKPKSAPYPSPFAKRLVDAPATPLEPQFLNRGSSFILRDDTPGRVIAVEDDSPGIWIELALGAGVADDPLVCDAWRAVTDVAAPRFDPLGADVNVRCGARQTVLEIWGLRANLEATKKLLMEMVAAPRLDDAAVAAHIRRTVERRQELRADSNRRELAFHVVATLGEHGVDPWMLDDEALQAAARDDFTWALRVSTGPPVDVLYAGPGAAAFAAEVAAGEGTRRPAEILRARTLVEPTVFVMHEPGVARAQIRRTMVAPIDDAAAVLRGDLLRHVAIKRFSHEGTEPCLRYWMGYPATLGAHGVVRNAANACPSRDAPGGVDAVSRTVDQAPTAADWSKARVSLEAALRGARRMGSLRAQYVRRWEALGTATDPATAIWTALATITDEELDAYWTFVASQPALITVTADLDAFDTDELRKWGTVVRVEPSALRDAAVTGARIFGYSYVNW